MSVVDSTVGPSALSFFLVLQTIVIAVCLVSNDTISPLICTGPLNNCALIETSCSDPNSTIFKTAPTNITKTIFAFEVAMVSPVQTSCVCTEGIALITDSHARPLYLFYISIATFLLHLLYTKNIELVLQICAHTKYARCSSQILYRILILPVTVQNILSSEMIALFLRWVWIKQPVWFPSRYPQLEMLIKVVYINRTCEPGLVH